LASERNFVSQQNATDGATLVVAGLRRIGVNRVPRLALSALGRAPWMLLINLHRYALDANHQWRALRSELRANTVLGLGVIKEVLLGEPVAALRRFPEIFKPFWLRAAPAMPSRIG